MHRPAVVIMLLLALAVSASPAKGPEAAPATASAMPPGMKQYWFVMLSRGPRRDEVLGAERQAEIQAGHMAHMQAEHAAGRLVLAGPFGDDGAWRGIQIYDAASLEQVQAICAADPAVVAGRLACEVRPWWGEVGTALK